MMTLRSLLWRFRLPLNALALAAVLTLYFSPVVSADPARECEGWCINWNERFGCVVYQVCCVYDDGSWECWQF